MATKAEERLTRVLVDTLSAINYRADVVAHELQLERDYSGGATNFFRPFIRTLLRQTEHMLPPYFQPWHEGDETFAVYATGANRMLELLHGAMASLDGVGLDSTDEEWAVAYEQCRRYMQLVAEVSQMLSTEGGVKLAASRESQPVTVSDAAPVPPSRSIGAFLPDETTTAPLDLDRFGAEALVVVDTVSLRLPDRFPGE